MRTGDEAWGAWAVESVAARGPAAAEAAAPAGIGAAAAVAAAAACMTAASTVRADANACNSMRCCGSISAASALDIPNAAASNSSAPGTKHPKRGGGAPRAPLPAPLPLAQTSASQRCSGVTEE
eukprot:362107-Chlamydomonas_euryale.AAC.5